MNDLELEKTLKCIPLPERTEEYWEHFPADVRLQLRRAAPSQSAGGNRLRQFARVPGFGLACLVLGLLVLDQPLKMVSSTIFQKERIIRRQLAQLPRHLRTFMADEHGLHYLIAEKE